jgi:alcohol dehydrogenase, propanol-preferring
LATMRAARMHGYKQPLKLEEIPIPEIEPAQVLVKVGGAGMCRTDFQLIDGYFGQDMPLPATPGHEIAGTVDRVGADVPASAELSEGDHVVVFGPRGDGSCKQCHRGNEHICNQGHWIGFGPHAGCQEYVPVAYAKLLGGGATVVALGRNEEKLTLAEANGADHAINIRDRSDDQVRDALEQATGKREFDAVIEYTLFGSFWGNYNDPTEVVALAEAGKIKDSVTQVNFEDVNDHIDALARGDFVGRAVIVYD